MQRVATIALYDCLDHVVIHAVVREYASKQDHTSAIVVDIAEMLPSRGDDEPWEWMERALQYLLHH